MEVSNIISKGSKLNKTLYILIHSDRHPLNRLELILSLHDYQ